MKLLTPEADAAEQVAIAERKFIPSKTGNKKQRAAAESADTMKKLLKLYRIGKNWDYLLVGDGSATTWEHEAGWACTLIERSTGDCFEFSGGANCGTNILAEMMAYVWPLLWLASNRELKMTRVHIITDCEHLPKAAIGEHSTKKYPELWHMLSAFSRRGLRLKWHWVPRDTIELNKFAHELANLARKAFKEGGFTAKALEKIKATKLSDLNS